MGFDVDKVQFNPPELAAGAAADAVYERFQKSLADGLNLNEVETAIASFGDFMAVKRYLFGMDPTGDVPSKLVVGMRLKALADMLIRDNV